MRKKSSPRSAVTYVLAGAILLTLVILAYSAGQKSATCNAVPLGHAGQLQMQAKLVQGPLLQTAEAQQKEHGAVPLPFYVTPAASVLREMALRLEPVTDKVGASWLPAEPNNQHTYDALYR